MHIDTGLTTGRRRNRREPRSYRPKVARSLPREREREGGREREREGDSTLLLTVGPVRCSPQFDQVKGEFTAVSDQHTKKAYGMRGGELLRILALGEGRQVNR